MSVYSNETITHRYVNDVHLRMPSLSHEAKAVLAAAAVWAVLLGVVLMHDVPENADLHSSTNVEDLRFDAPESAPDADDIVPLRQHY